MTVRDLINLLEKAPEGAELLIADAENFRSFTSLDITYDVDEDCSVTINIE